MSELPLDTGVFVFSWDFELAWGFHDNPQIPTRLRDYDTRRYIGKLIDILQRNDVPSTWATVGHLLLERCERTDDGPHPELSTPTSNWYDSDPCTTVREDPLWYAPDLIDRLRSCEANQEIGSHTFSHITTDVEETILSAELAKCRELAAADEMGTFVSPRHGTVPVEILADSGYHSYRVPSSTPSWRRAVSFYTGVGGPNTGIPTKQQGGIWHHPVSTYFFYNPLNSVQRRLPWLKRRWFETGLQRAAARGEVFHVWAHPHNFVGDDHAINQFCWLIERVAELRDAGRIQPMTIARLTKHMEEDG